MKIQLRDIILPIWTAYSVLFLLGKIMPPREIAEPLFILCFLANMSITFGCVCYFFICLGKLIVDSYRIQKDKRGW